MQAHPISPPKPAPRRGLARRRHAFSLPLLTQELHTLLDAGLSLNEALDALAEREPPGTAREVLHHLQTDLRDGRRFSDAAERQGGHFSPLFVGMLRAAEHTGDLSRALQRYLDYHTRTDQLRSRIVSAAIYPFILCLVGGVVTLFLMLQVVPSFAEVYRDSGRAMPWASALLLRTGHGLREHLLLVSAATAVLVFICIRRLRTAAAQGGWVGLLQHLPGLGPQVRTIELARLYLTLGMLLEGGIAARPALALIGRTVTADTARRLAGVDRALSGGEALSRAFEQQGLHTPVALRMLRVGERTGRLGSMLTRAAQFHDGENARFVERFTKAFEPALMALIGLVIAAIVLLLYLPIFDLAGSLK